ncbi:hypothetical protein NPX13_g6185 [Xylaria arbuscula]|uniref:NACHT domain-containing protein n=1 Tax=Xylaria arbuscula TaxID=114810 RepID=A0A9W8ND02_9PEZI|nr:hypothetical protein NPX13_g6185 [Xylaria arbuscula]
MEPAGLAVGIAGLIGVFSTCLDIIERWDSYKDFGAEFGSLITRFKADKIRFRQWGQRVGIDKSKHGDGYHKALDDPSIRPVVDEILQSIKHFDDDTGNFTSALRPISGSVDTLAHSKTVLPRGRPQFEKYQGATSRKSRLGWALRGKTRFLALVESFDALVQKLYDLVPPDQTVPGQIISEGRYSNLASLNDETRKGLNEWLDTHDSKQMYDDFVRRRLDGTCDWILNRSEFLQWQLLPSNNAKLLWVHGPPGYGKTILCARIVQHLIANSGASLAYFFFSSELETRENPFAIMRSWISQITIQNRDAFNIAQEKLEATDGCVASRTDIEELFESITQNIPECIFVVDGLDECAMRENDSKMIHRESLLEFLKSLRDIISKSKSRLLVVSRNEQEIRQGLNNKTTRECELLELQILPQDVESDATMFSQSIVEEKLANKSETQRRELAHRMVDRCESMFLGIKLLEPDLVGGQNLKQLRRLIDEAPNRLDRIYDRNWERIRNLADDNRYRAFSILRWATFALRPMTIYEITEALLLVDDDCGELDYTELPDAVDEVYIKTRIVELCGSLIEVRKAELASGVGHSTIHLSHFSVRQYLMTHMPACADELITNEQLRSSNEAIQSNILAKTCIRYLNCQDVWRGIEQLERVDSVVQAFRGYAANSWHKHVKQEIINSKEVTRLINLFFSPANENWESWRKNSENALQNRMIQYEGEVLLGNPLFYASLLGFSETVAHLIENVGIDVNCVDSSNRTAILAASSKSWVSGVIQLLKKGASVNIASNKGRTPIYAGASEGCVEIVKLLLEEGADLTVATKDGWTPLNSASSNGHIEVVKLLLEKGADLTVANKNRWTPLDLASYNGHIDVVKFLLENATDVAAANGSTPLIRASSNGHDKIVNLLLAQQNVDLQFSDVNGRTALSWAATKGHKIVIELLIADERFDGNSQDHTGLTPLMWASQKSQDSVVELLVQHGCCVHDNNMYSFFFQVAMFMMHKAFEEIAAAMHFETDDFTLELAGLFKEIE